MDNNKFDDALFEILKECKTLPTFLQTIFAFLKRRTDFYCIAPDRNSQVGLPEGVAEYLVRDAFIKCKSDPFPEDVAQTVDVTTEFDDEQPEPSRPVEVAPAAPSDAFTSADCYNGRVFDNYSWSQTIREVDLMVKLPENVTPKSLNVSILPQSLTVSIVPTNQVLFAGDLCQKVKHKDSLWSLDKRKLEIHLEKVAEKWWNCFLQTEPKLDVSKIDCSRPFEELPDEARAKIEQLTWNQERKRLGLPTSEEMVLQEKLKKAWNAEGSPFQGPFDPNAVITS